MDFWHTILYVIKANADTLQQYYQYYNDLAFING